MTTALWHEVPDLARLNAWGTGSMHGHVGLEFTAFGDDWLRARLPVDFRTRQLFGLLHGGASLVAAEGVDRSQVR